MRSGRATAWGGGRTTPRVGLKPIPVPTPDYVLTEDVRKDVPGSMMFADDIVLCGDDETDMTEY